MSICEYSINMQNKCCDCIYFRKYDEKNIYGECICENNKIKNRRNRSEMSKSCTWKTTKK